MSSSKIFQIIFIVGSTSSLFIQPECLNNSWCSFSSSFLELKTEEEFALQSYPFFQRFVILACYHPLIIVFNCENSFHLSEAIQDSFQFDSSKAIISGLFILSFQLSFSKSYRCIIQIFSNQASSFFSNSSWCFAIFSLIVFNSYGGSFEIFLFLCYRINLLVVSILPVVH